MGNYPDKPIRIVTVEAGGGGDLVANLVAKGLADAFHQRVEVDNRLETLAIDLVGKAPPDGYTLLIFGSPFWIRPLVQSTSYDPVRDFAPIAILTMSPLVLVVHPSVAVTSVKELIAEARAHPGKLRFGCGLNGSSSQLGGSLFAHMTGVDIACVPYKTGPLSLKDLFAGKVQMMVPSAGTVMPFVREGKLRALGVTSAEASPLLPGLQPVAVDVPGYEVVQSIIMYAPTKTPPDVVSRLNQEVARVLKTAANREKLMAAGLEPIGSTPEALAARMTSEMAKWGKVIKDAGIRAN